MTKSGDDNKAEEARSDCKAANQPPESSSKALTDDALPNQHGARALHGHEPSQRRGAGLAWARAELGPGTGSVWVEIP